jgi:predicted GNAT family acetyltransferase
VNTPPKITVEHHPAERRFVADIDGALAVLEYWPIDERTLDYRRTYTPPSLRGHGIASEITARALDYALEQGLRVVPSCPFVATFIERHPQYRQLLTT